ncbi:efflux RND transporter permease subunit [Roseinatronobacter sp. S2]|uniref:efflux RND transporter permease subunit n=1 Tax=Roseinatronobacter sp. S2 TaxID=3035471 RepID=UPI00240F4C7A|nr:efflux RND transporter permease subunit [Roseinatronobacter sp. S2]WFE76595.1 efflux RND transporter permease subunit [Roseinatronobacter sp. S2]
MHGLINAAFSRMRTMLLLLVLTLLAGGYSYVTIPKEATPEIDIPVFIVNVSYSGISPEDSARLLVEPLERQFQGLAGLREMRADAGEGFARMTLEFTPGFDQQTALQSVRDEADNAQPALPAGADPPVVNEVDMSLFPILTVALSGNVPERELIAMARELQDRVEGLTGVLEANLSGARDDLMEIIVNPLAMQSYGLSTQEISQVVQNNNQLVPAGAFDTGAGNIGVAIPGTVETVADVLTMPVQVSNGTVVRVQDVAEVRQTFQDPVSFARLDGQATIGLDISKTAGANVIDTVDAVRAAAEDLRGDWGDAVQISFLQDQAEDIQTLLSDLENNVIAAVLLVMLTTLLALGLRASLLVAVAIPGAFLGGILAINLFGFTLNIVVLFGLILVVGMLVDGTIVVVELAERYRAEGFSQREAFLKAAQRMSWPITAAVATTLAVFVPLLFWPGIAGQFMFYLPATVIVTLSASLLMALVFVPLIGSLYARRVSSSGVSDSAARPAFYDRILTYVIARPGFALGVSLLALVVSFAVYSALGRGVEFFPAVEPDRAQVQIEADGNLSVHEADRLVRMVENRIIGMDGVNTVYARTIGTIEERLQSNLAPNTIGTLQIDFTDWRIRAPVSEIIDTMRARTQELPGIRVLVEAQEAGPGEARPIQIEVAAQDRALLPDAARRLQRLMEQRGTFTDITSDVPDPSPEVRIQVDREQAARYGVDIDTLGSTVQLLTRGVTLGTYLPAFAPDEVDIRLRYPAEERTFAQLSTLRIATQAGMVPIANFVTITAAPASPVITRVDARNVQTISAGIAAGTTVAEEIAVLQRIIDAEDFNDGVDIRFAGEIEDQQEAITFLITAFIVAVFLMFAILLTQLNSFFQSILVLSAIIFSLAGVLLALVIRQEAFSVVMSGIGIVALAGIVVNNNIVLIDAYNEHHANGLPPAEAAFRAGGERFRPVLLTAVTTVVGLMPLVLGLTVDFFGRDLFVGAPSGQFWVQLSTAIVGGLVFSSVITILLTPALLAWDGNRRDKRAGRDDRL